MGSRTMGRLCRRRHRVPNAVAVDGSQTAGSQTVAAVAGTNRTPPSEAARRQTFEASTNESDIVALGVRSLPSEVRFAFALRSFLPSDSASPFRPPTASSRVAKRRSTLFNKGDRLRSEGNTSSGSGPASAKKACAANKLQPKRQRRTHR